MIDFKSMNRIGTEIIEIAQSYDLFYKVNIRETITDYEHLHLNISIVENLSIRVRCNLFHQ